MAYQCFHCEKPADSVHTFTVYDENGVEERLEVLCSECYAEWLESLKSVSTTVVDPGEAGRGCGVISSTLPANQ